MKPFYTPTMQQAARNLQAAIARAAGRPLTVWGVLWPLLKPWKWIALLALALTIVQGFAISFQNLAPKWLISDVLSPPGLTTHQRLARAALLALAYLFATIVLRMLAWHAGYRLFTAVRERIVFTIRSFFFKHVSHLCLRFHGGHPSGELFNYLFGSPLATFVAFYQNLSMSVIGNLFTLLSTVILISLWDPVLMLVLLATALATTVVLNRARKRVHALQKEYQQAESSVSGQAADLLRGSKAVKLHGMEEQAAQEFERGAYRLWLRSYDRDIRTHMEWMKQEGISYIAYGVLILTAAWRFVHGKADLGMIAAFLNSFTGIMGPLASIFTAVTQWSGAQASIERLGAVLQTPSSTPDPADGGEPVPDHGDYRLEQVTFRYAENQPPVLNQLTLTIPFGQKIAFVGPSGSGKTTLSSLLLRLYDPQEGRILLGGTDLRRFHSADLRRAIGVVPQDPFIFRTTIRDNLRLARPEASDDAIIRACQRARAWEFIERLPHRLEEKVGEGGSSLSGGQRQRLAIARALLADPHFFIFDEATSALDTISEQLIQASIEEELRGRTAIFIAHRLATVKRCDRILVLQDGRILQDGSYAELAARPGLFRTLVEGQRLA
ncbi:MAG: ABC transporter ATP-binding protein [Lentisphaeria bacterium]|jgi:ABC-type multidrug transport system fused ATPase/permease subunit